MRPKPAALTYVAAALVAAAGLASVASAFPKPSLYPVSWELDFQSETPKRIVIESPGQSPKAYWYMTYVATNYTQQDQIFLPTFEMVTKTGKVVPSLTAPTPRIFEAIARRERNKPLQPTLKLQGQILVGEDQAKYGVAVWPEPEARMGSFTIFVGGMSGETATLADADGKPLTNKDGSPIVLRKTQQLDFNVRGDELYAGDPIEKTGETWVMR